MRQAAPSWDGRRGRPRRRKQVRNNGRWGAALAGIAALALGGCATAGEYNPGGLAAADHEEVAGLCTGVMGISRGVAQFDACLESLSGSVRGLSRGRALMDARSDCLRQGYAPQTPGLAQCELARSRSDPTGPVLAAAEPPPRLMPARSYWSASNAEIHRREETACAHLGLEPAGGAFAQCVADLDASLFAANNPSQ